jgi:hypothetical protein
MKVSWDVKMGFNKRFTGDGENGIHICFRRLVFEYVMLIDG